MKVEARISSRIMTTALSSDDSLSPDEELDSLTNTDLESDVHTDEEETDSEEVHVEDVEANVQDEENENEDDDSEQQHDDMDSDVENDTSAHGDYDDGYCDSETFQVCLHLHPAMFILRKLTSTPFLFICICTYIVMI